LAEERAHFEHVLEQLRKRGYKFAFPRKDEYAEELFKVIVKGGNRDQQLVERLLMNALIEAANVQNSLEEHSR
jgi:tRNA-(ms[2]io[6]A)-hydroxylase